MINIDTWSSWSSWSSWFAIFFTSGSLLLTFASLLYSLYLSRRHMGAIKEALKNSRYICIWGPGLGRRGLIWSLLEMAKITGMIMMPKTYIRLGDLNSVDFEDFPPYLKRLLKLNLMVMIAADIWLVMAFIFVKLR